jgi:hypothetical protein
MPQHLAAQLAHLYAKAGKAVLIGRALRTCGKGHAQQHT